MDWFAGGLTLHSNTVWLFTGLYEITIRNAGYWEWEKILRVDSYTISPIVMRRCKPTLWRWLEWSAYKFMVSPSQKKYVRDLAYNKDTGLHNGPRCWLRPSREWRGWGQLRAKNDSARTEICQLVQDTIRSHLIDMVGTWFAVSRSHWALEMGVSQRN